MGILEAPPTFVAEVEDSHCIAYKGQRIEYFTTFESPASIAALDRVLVMYVKETAQCLIIQKIA